MFGFSGWELYHWDNEKDRRRYMSLPASITFGIIMFIVSIIMMVTAEPFPSAKVRNELNKEKVEYIQNYCIDHGLLTKRQKERLGLADN
jgi:hypothetical protein